MSFGACGKGAPDCAIGLPDAGNPEKRLEFQRLMPRYYFHLYNDLAATDDEGRELADLGAARRAAEQDAREMAARSVQCHGHLNLAHYVEVTDERGESVVRVRFGEAVTIMGADRAHERARDPNLDQ